MRHVLATKLLGALLLAPVAAAAFEGDPAKGQTLATGVCAACHGPDGNSPLPVNPSLAGQIPDYLYKQLRDFKSGARKNAVMTGMVATLSEEDMRNVAAYFAGQKPRPGVARDAALANAGQNVYRGRATPARACPRVPAATPPTVSEFQPNFPASRDSTSITRWPSSRRSGPVSATTTPPQ